MRLLTIALLLCLNVFAVRGQRAEANVSYTDFGRGVPVDVFWSPDGSAFWVVTRINTLWRYDATTMQGELMLEGVKGARYSEDGRFLITRGMDDVESYRLTNDVSKIVPYVVPMPQATLDEPSVYSPLYDLPERDRYIWGALSPSGALFLDYDDAGNGRVWEVATGELALKLPSDETYLSPEERAKMFMPEFGPELSIWRLSWSTDSSHIFRCHSSGGDTYVNCLPYNVETGERGIRASGEAWSWNITFSPDRRFFTLSQGIYNANTGELINSFRGFGGIEQAWSSDTHFLAMSGRNSSYIDVYDSTIHQLRHRLYVEGSQTGTKIFKWSPNNRHLLSWGSWSGYEFGSGLISLWNIETGHEIGRVNQHAFLGHQIAFNSDSSRLAATDALGNAAIFDSASSELVHTLRGAEAQITRLEWQPGGNLLAVNDVEQRFDYNPYIPPDADIVRVWDAATGNLIAALDHKSFVYAISWSPNGDQLITDDERGIYLWNSLTYQQVYFGRSRGAVYSFPNYQWSADSRVLRRTFRACSHSAGAVELFDMVAFKPLYLFDCFWLAEFYPVWSERLDQAISTWWQCNTNDPTDLTPCTFYVRLYEDRNQPFADYTRIIEPSAAYTFGAYRTIQNTRWSPDNTRLLVLTGGSADVWRLYLDHAEQEQHFAGVLDAFWSDDGEQLALVTLDGVQVADVGSGEVFFTLNDVQAPQWMSDHLRVCRGDPCVGELWNVDTGQLLLSGDLPNVVSPNGRYGAGTVNGVFRLWTFSQPE